MAQLSLNIGSEADDGTGDTLRDGMDKVNTNFTELYERTYLTATDQTSLLTNSRHLIAGSGLSFDDSVSGERTINVAGAAAISEATGTYSATSSDWSSYSVTIRYVRVGHFVNLSIISGDTAKGTLKADPGTQTFILSGSNMPLSIRPSSNTSAIPIPNLLENSSPRTTVHAVVQTDGAINFRKAGPTNGSSWFNADGNGINGQSPQRVSFTYVLPF